MLHLEYNPINFIINYTIVEIFPSCVPVSKVDALEFIICCVKRILAFGGGGETERGKRRKIYGKERNGKRYREARVHRQSRIIKRAMEGQVACSFVAVFSPPLFLYLNIRVGRVKSSEKLPIPCSLLFHLPACRCFRLWANI